MKKKEAYKTKLKAQLAEWDVQISLFAVKTNNATADVQIKLCVGT